MCAIATGELTATGRTFGEAQADLARERAALARRLAEIDAELGGRPVESPLCEARFEAVVALDDDCVIVDASRPARELAGGEIVGLRPWELRGRAGLEVPCRAAMERLAREPAEAIRAQVETEDGGGRPVSLDLVVRARADRAGRLRGMIVEAVDVTARRRAERAASVAESRLRDALDEIDDVITIYSVSDRSIVHLGGSIWTLLGQPPRAAGISEAEMFAALHPEDRPRAMAAHVELLTKGSSEVELRIVREDGQTRWIRNRSRAIRDASGAVVRTAGVMSDVTERVAAREALEALNAELERRVAVRTRELEQALRAKDEFLAAMSHELRTPLNAVLGLSESLQEGVYGPLGPRQAQAVGQVAERGAHLLALIEAIFDQANLELGRITLARAPVPVMPLCRAALRSVQGMADRKRQTLALESALDEALTIDADAQRVAQILINLLSNAVKFTPEGGSIALSTRVDRARGTLAMTVSDTGCGVASADFERIFLPFVQLDARLARAHAGTGLGLALVRRLVDLHGGSVGVESEIGKGSRFTVTLPV